MAKSRRHTRKPTFEHNITAEDLIASVERSEANQTVDHDPPETVHALLVALTGMTVILTVGNMLNGSITWMNSVMLIVMGFFLLLYLKIWQSEKEKARHNTDKKQYLKYQIQYKKADLHIYVGLTAASILTGLGQPMFYFLAFTYGVMVAQKLNDLSNAKNQYNRQYKKDSH